MGSPNNVFVVFPMMALKTQQQKAVNLLAEICAIQDGSHRPIVSKDLGSRESGIRRASSGVGTIRRMSSMFGGANLIKPGTNLSSSEQEFMDQFSINDKDKARMVETMIISDSSVANLCGSRILASMFQRLGHFAQAISHDSSQVINLNESGLVNQNTLSYVIFVSSTLHLSPAAVSYLRFACKQQHFSITSVLPSNEIAISVDSWKDDAISGRLWSDRFWEVVSSMHPDLKNDEKGRASIVQDFEVLARNTNFQFSPDANWSVMNAQFERISERNQAQRRNM